MIELVGLVAFGVTVYAAITYADRLQHRRRIAAWSERADELRRLRGTR